MSKAKGQNEQTNEGYQPTTGKKGYQPLSKPAPEDSRTRGGYQPISNEGGSPTNNPPGED